MPRKQTRPLKRKDVLQVVKIFRSWRGGGGAAGLTDSVSDLKWMKCMRSKSNRAAKVECIRVGLAKEVALS